MGPIFGYGWPRRGHHPACYTEKDSLRSEPPQPRPGEGGSSSAVAVTQLGPLAPRLWAEVRWFLLCSLVQTASPQRSLRRCSPPIAVFAVALSLTFLACRCATTVCRLCHRLQVNCVRFAANDWRDRWHRCRAGRSAAYAAASNLLTLRRPRTAATKAGFAS